MSYIKKVDHITYACAAGKIEKWAWFHIEVEGGTLINRIDDVRPGDPDSSMKIWCIDYGDFGVALIEGIDRAKKSQVTKFVDRHGDHACQHVAYDTYDLEKFSRICASSAAPLVVARWCATTASGSSSRCSLVVTRRATLPKRRSRSTCSDRPSVTPTRCTSPSPRRPAAASTTRSKMPSQPTTRSRSSTSRRC